MTTPSPLPFESLLSTRARYAVPLTTPRASMQPLYEFGGGFPDPASFPYDGMVDATARMMKAEGAAAMTYGDPQGYLGLRELVCQKYELFESMKTAPENIVVANGSGQALSLAFSAFVDPGDPIIVEAPTFSGSLNTIRRHGPRVLDVPVDDEGIVTDAVRERLAALRREGRRCKLIYTIVNFQNPAGPSQSLRRRHELIELAHEFDTLILEDDAYGELRFEGQTLPPLYALDAAGRVIRAGTVSKILGAGVRLGWLDRSYREVVDKGWRAVQARVSPTGELVDVCTGTGAGQNATREYYLNRPALFGRDDRGGAMALTAALEMHALTSAR